VLSLWNTEKTIQKYEMIVNWTQGDTREGKISSS
jgi:hypothetical protein